MSNKSITGLRYSRDNWFTCIDTAVLTDKFLSTSAKQVFYVLCMLAGFGSRSCSPTAEQVADITCNTLQKLHLYYEELQDRGVIAIEEGTIYIIGHNAPCYEEDA